MGSRSNTRTTSPPSRRHTPTLRPSTRRWWRPSASNTKSTLMPSARLLRRLQPRRRSSMRRSEPSMKSSEPPMGTMACTHMAPMGLVAHTAQDTEQDTDTLHLGTDLGTEPGTEPGTDTRVLDTPVPDTLHTHLPGTSKWSLETYRNSCILP